MTWFNRKKTQKAEKTVETKPLVKDVTKTRKVKYDTSALKRVWITEKSTELGNLRKYVFLTDRKINAAEIKKAVEGIYNVIVEKIHVINFSRRKKFRGRPSKTEHYKKAIVTLAKGQELDIIPK